MQDDPEGPDIGPGAGVDGGEVLYSGPPSGLVAAAVAVDSPTRSYLRGEAAVPRPTARAADAGLVVCGHSHVPLLVRDGDLVVFNPGSCGPRRVGLPITFGVIDIGPEGATLRHVDWFEMTQVRGQVKDGAVEHFQVGLKIGFRLEDD